MSSRDPLLHEPPAGITGRAAGDARWWRQLNLFWLSVIVALISLCCASTVNDDPAVLHSGNGLLTLVLVLAYAAWFFEGMLRHAGRHSDGEEFDARPALRLVRITMGPLLTVALIMLHSEFSALVFPVISVVAFAIDSLVAAIPIAGVTAIYLYGRGVFYHPDLAEAGGDLLSIISIVAIIYSLILALRGRIARDKLIAELREAHEQLRIASAREVELAALRERNRLAREMHDSLGHALVLIAVKIEAAQRLNAVDPARAAAEWEATKMLVRSTMADLRTSLAGLRMPVLEEHPFHTALTDLVTATGRNTEIDIRVEIPDEAGSLPRQIQEALYRVAQEGMANVARHSQAQHAWLRLAIAHGIAELEIEDDGIGLDQSVRSAGSHFGVVGMRERVEDLGGRLAIGPRPDGGTRLRATIPVVEGADVRHPHPVG